jgi:hypothetical protein
VALKFFHGGLTAAAVAVTVPLLIVNLLYLPLLLCRRLGQHLGNFYRKVAIGPVLHVLPFTACLAIGRLLFASYPIPALALCAAGGITLAVFYWRSVLPQSLKAGLTRKFEKLTRRAPVAKTAAAVK